MQIIPAILATSEEIYKQQVEQVNLIAVDADGWVHIDFADNVFVQSKTVGLDVVQKYPVGLKKEAHLMVKDPGLLCSELVNVGFERIILHLESDNLDLSINTIKDQVEVGIAINPETSLEALVPYLNKINLILIMGIRPGFQGQEFIPGMIQKIKSAKQYGVTIEVDGGITPENARMIADAGADGLIIGSHLLNGDVRQNLEQFKEILT